MKFERTAIEVHLQKKTNFVSIVLFRTAKRVFCTFAHVEGVDVGRIFRNFARVIKNKNR